MGKARTLRQTALREADRILYRRVDLILYRAFFRPTCGHASLRNSLAVHSNTSEYGRPIGNCKYGKRVPISSP